MELNKENLTWISANKMLALVLLQMVVIGFLFRTIINLHETIEAKADQESLRKDEAIKMYRDSWIMSKQIEQASRKINNDTTYGTR